MSFQSRPLPWLLVVAWVGCQFANSSQATAQKPTDVVVVAAEEFDAALQPWIDLRTRQGLTVAIARPTASTAQTHANIWAAGGEATRYVVLVGDAPDFDTQSTQSSQIPTHMIPAPTTSRFGSTPTLPTDLPYGDRDLDDINDAAVGRLPVKSAEQLSQLIRRIEAYENSDDFGLWRRSFQLTGGVGGFGAMVDGAIETITRGVITTVLPADAKPQIAYASPKHLFCPTGESFTDAVINRYRIGARFWVYAGHGQIDRLELLQTAAADGTPTPREQWTVTSLLDNESAARLQRPPAGASIAVLLACYAGAYDAPGDCLAERMLLADGGPIAVIASSRLSMPYGNACLGLGLLESVYSGGEQRTGCERLGDAMLHAARGMQIQKGPKKSAMRATVDALAGLISPAGNDLNQERLEHAALYQLLGDPTLRLHPPQRLDMKVESSIEAATSRSIDLAITSPIAGTLAIHIDRPLTAANESDGSKTPVDHDAHHCTIADWSIEVPAGQRILKTIPLPLGEPGPLIIRGFVHGQTTWASAAQRMVLPE